jgi:hypothetical protein
VPPHHVPALSDEWAQLTAARQVELKLKTLWRDGSTHLAMSLMEFIQRLAALVLQPPYPAPPSFLVRPAAEAGKAARTGDMAT